MVIDISDLATAVGWLEFLMLLINDARPFVPEIETVEDDLNEIREFLDEYHKEHPKP